MENDWKKPNRYQTQGLQDLSDELDKEHTELLTWFRNEALTSLMQLKRENNNPELIATYQKIVDDFDELVKTLPDFLKSI